MRPPANRLLPRNVPKCLNGGVLALVLASALAVPATVEAQRAVRRDDGSPVGGGAPSGGGSSSEGGSSGGSGGGASRRDPSTSSGPTGSSSGRTASGSGGSTASSGGRSGASAAPSGTTTTATTTSSGASSGDRSGRGSSDDVPNYSRPRGNQPATGTAVARRGAPPYGDGDDLDIYVPGGYYPWGYGGFGFGGYYGYYDPWYGYDYYGGQPYYANIGDGSLRLKVKPREATVYADGYYVGRVDDFDGMFQRLHIEPGPHRIEIRADGYETLEFEVRLLPDKTTTYEGELKRLP